MSNKFKISGVGIDTTRINKILNKNELEDYTYIHTSISAGNDTLIKSGIKDNQILITSIDFLDHSDTAIIHHLEELVKDSINLLLIDSKCNFEDNIDNINNLIISGNVQEIGISNPTSVKRLEELKNLISQISYISLNICPLCFPWSIIRYCEENNIKILGFNPFGGRINYPRLIDSFSVPYLLSFISAYSDIVFLSGNNLNVLDSETEYLMDLIDKEYGSEFELSKDVDKLFKEPKKTINTSLKLGDSIIIPYDNPENIFNYQELIFGLGKINIKSSKQDDELVSAVYEFYSSFEEGPVDNPTPQNVLSLLRYNILNLTRLQYSEVDGWSVFCTKISDLTFVISGVRKVKKSKLFKKSEEIIEQVNYILHFNGTDLIFQNLKNALKED